MATFKVGQRVKRVASGPFGVPLGETGTLIANPSQLVAFTSDPGVDVAWDNPHWERIGVDPNTLAPLTDPKADAFIESIKRLKVYDEPKVIPAKETT